jgi:hypothetical protein
MLASLMLVVGKREKEGNREGAEFIPFTSPLLHETPEWNSLC